MSDDKERRYLDAIPTELGDEAIPLIVTLNFDAPKEFNDKSKFNDQMYTVYFYTVTDENGGEGSIRAYEGLHKKIKATGARRGDVISIRRWGSGKTDTQWRVDLVEKNSTGGPADVPANAQEKRQMADTRVAPSGKMVYYPLTDDQIDVIVHMGRSTLETIRKMMSMVETFEEFADLSLEQKSKLAITAYINAIRDYRPGMVIANQVEKFGELNHEDMYMILAGERVGGMDIMSTTAGTIIQTIAEYEEVEMEEVSGVLLGLGITSADIDDTDTLTWRRVYRIFTAKKAGNMSDADIRKTFDIRPAF